MMSFLSPCSNDIRNYLLPLLHPLFLVYQFSIQATQLIQCITITFTVITHIYPVNDVPDMMTAAVPIILQSNGDVNTLITFLRHRYPPAKTVHQPGLRKLWRTLKTGAKLIIAKNMDQDGMNCLICCERMISIWIHSIQKEGETHIIKYDFFHHRLTKKLQRRI